MRPSRRTAPTPRRRSAGSRRRSRRPPPRGPAARRSPRTGRAEGRGRRRRARPGSRAWSPRAPGRRAASGAAAGCRAAHRRCCPPSARRSPRRGAPSSSRRSSPPAYPLAPATATRTVMCMTIQDSGTSFGWRGVGARWEGAGHGSRLPRPPPRGVRPVPRRAPRRGPQVRGAACPDWTADDLLWHLGEVQEFWGLIVEGRLQDPEAAVKSERPDSRAGLVDFFAAQTERLERVLREADPAEPVWMWANDKTVGYIRRRQAHEALIHRLDAELTAGAGHPARPRARRRRRARAARRDVRRLPAVGHLHARRRPRRRSSSPTRRSSSRSSSAGSPAPTPTTARRTTRRTSRCRRRPATRCPPRRLGQAADLDAWLWHRRDATASRSRATTRSRSAS